MKSFRGYVTENGTHNGKNGGGKGETFPQKNANETGDDVKITAERLTKQIAAAYRGQSNKNVLADIISSAEKGRNAYERRNRRLLQAVFAYAEFRAKKKTFADYRTDQADLENGALPAAESKSAEMRQKTRSEKRGKKAKSVSGSVSLRQDLAKKRAADPPAIFC